MEVRDALYIIFGYLLGSILFARLGGLIFKRQTLWRKVRTRTGHNECVYIRRVRCGVFTLCGDLLKGFFRSFLYRSGELPENPLMLSFVMAARSWAIFCRFMTLNTAAKALRQRSGAFGAAALDPSVRFGGHLHFFSCVVKINPELLPHSGDVYSGGHLHGLAGAKPLSSSAFLLIAASVLAKLFMSAEEKRTL